MSSNPLWFNFKLIPLDFTLTYGDVIHDYLTEGR
jgi:hypothetical protein